MNRKGLLALRHFFAVLAWMKEKPPDANEQIQHTSFSPNAHNHNDVILAVHREMFVVGNLYKDNIAAQVSSACVAIKTAIEREMQLKLRVLDEKEEKLNSLSSSEQKKIDALRIKEYRKMIDRRI